MIASILTTIQSHPENWKIVFQNKNSIVFALGDYRFTRLSDRFNCVMMLNSKNNIISANYSKEDQLAAEAYNSLVYTHLR